MAEEKQGDCLVYHVALGGAVDVGEDFFFDALVGVGEAQIEVDGGVLKRAGDGYDVVDLYVFLCIVDGRECAGEC